MSQMRLGSRWPRAFPCLLDPFVSERLCCCISMNCIRNSWLFARKRRGGEERRARNRASLLRSPDATRLRDHQREDARELARDLRVVLSSRSHRRRACRLPSIERSRCRCHQATRRRAALTDDNQPPAIPIARRSRARFPVAGGDAIDLSDVAERLRFVQRSSPPNFAGAMFLNVTARPNSSVMRFVPSGTCPRAPCAQSMFIVPARRPG